MQLLKLHEYHFSCESSYRANPARFCSYYDNSNSNGTNFLTIRQPLVIGFMVAGIIVGPHTPPFSLIHEVDALNLFAEIGVVLLLFTVGMEFPINKLKKLEEKP